MTRRPWPALIRWAAVVVWMAVIFALSAQSGGPSSGLSDTVVRVLRQLSGGLLAHVADETLQLVVRKCAHFCAYLILGALVAYAWLCWPGRRLGAVSKGRTTDRRQQDRRSRAAVDSERRLVGEREPSAERQLVSELDRPDRPRTARRWWRVSDWSRLGPVAMAAAYAATDEIHQSFVAGRSAQVTDVLIDTAGVVVGVGLVALLTRGAHKARSLPEVTCRPGKPTDPAG